MAITKNIMSDRLLRIRLPYTPTPLPPPAPTVREAVLGILQGTYSGSVLESLCEQGRQQQAFIEHVLRQVTP
jgi:hypothetical protein